MNRDRFADPGIATADERHFALKLAGRFVMPCLRFRARAHLAFDTGLPRLRLWRPLLFCGFRIAHGVLRFPLARTADLSGGSRFQAWICRNPLPQGGVFSFDRMTESSYG